MRSSDIIPLGAVVLAVTISYSLFGGIQGALRHGLPKSDTRIEDGEHKPKGGERK
ncbi:hypothetical protein FACS1894188_13550 [Clostridia bacterium]|nr:hypothetical protein FACS1894188_13550 [Clostridia bacterium]